MKFATLGHLDNDGIALKQMPKDWKQGSIIASPEFDCNGTKGHFVAVKLTPNQMMSLPREKVRQEILDVALFAQSELDVELIQLGALTTSVTNGGVWLVDNEDYTGFVNHGDSYTASITCQNVLKALKLVNKKPSDLSLSIIGAYGIIGEAVSKILVPKFHHSILVGRRQEKIDEIASVINGDFSTTIQLETGNADVVVTATNHPNALLRSGHLKKNSIVVDVSQPVNVSQYVCQQRPDILRVDGGFVDFLPEFRVPTLPSGKLFSCIVEVIMQAMENERQNHVGSIDLEHLRKTEIWAEKYGFTLNELTNFGKTIDIGMNLNVRN